MKVAFMGSDPIALPMLESLAEASPGGAELAMVFTQPDRRTGRGMHLQANAIKKWALKQELPVHQPARCGAEEAALLAAESVDLVLVMAYGQILPGKILQTPPLGVLNLHASILPRLRGASPIHTAIATGLKESGVSLMKVTPKMDAGPVADVEKVRIDFTDTSGDLHDHLAGACPVLIRRCLPEVAEHKLVFKEQDPAAVTYCRIIQKSDANLDFHESAEHLYNRVRAFTPWPGSVFPCNGVEVRILEAALDPEDSPAPPGTVIEADGPELAIACGQGILKASRLQRPGGKPLAADAFLRGFPIQAGAVIASREMAPLEGSSPFPYRKKRKSPDART